MNRKKSWLSFLFKLCVFLILSLTVTHIYFHSGFPYTHDGENHLARFASYKQAIREGQFPPRFAPNLFSRYGYPVFNYNYPLANILSLPFSFVHINYEVTFKILAMFAVMFGIWGTWEWLKALGIEKKGRVVAVCLYVLSPYLFSTVLFRGNIGEIFALSLLPWVLWSVDQVKSFDWKWRDGLISIILWSAFLLSHNVTVIFTLPILILYVLLRKLWLGQGWKRILLISGMGILLTLWFWLPAVAEKSFTVVDEANVNSQVLQHFPTLTQLFFSPLQFGFSEKGPADGLSFGLGFTQLILLFLGTILSVKYFFQKWILKSKNEVHHQRQYFLLIGLVIVNWLLIIFQLGLTAPVWSLFLFVSKYIQFPWRLAIFFSVLILPLAAMVFIELPKKLQMLILGLLIWQAIGAYRAKPVDYFHRDIQDYDYFTQSTSTNNENRAKTFNYTFAGDWQPTAQLEAGEGKIEVIKWLGSTRTYKLHLVSDATIIEPTMNFPGWQTEVRNESTPEKGTTQIKYIDSSTIGGRIAYQLPAGDYLVKSVFTQWTWARIIGNSISLLSGLVLIGSFILMIRRKKHV
jgi:hypothetical protein